MIYCKLISENEIRLQHHYEEGFYEVLRELEKGEYYKYDEIKNTIGIYYREITEDQFEQKRKQYIIEKVKERYTITSEMRIHREALLKKTIEFDDYNNYVKKCIDDSFIYINKEKENEDIKKNKYPLFKGEV